MSILHKDISIRGAACCALIILSVVLNGCASPEAATPETPAPAATVQPTELAVVPTQSPPTPTPTSTPALPDYARLEAALVAYDDMLDFEIGIGVIDLTTGAQVGLNEEERFYALSTFKGPLAAYYLWLLESDLITEASEDEAYLSAMLAISDNPATTCVFKRVNGIAPFNDWLVEQGFDPVDNYIYSWDGWRCNEDDVGWVPDRDARVLVGGNLPRCPAEDGVICDKAFTPLALAEFYAQVYQGELLNTDARDRWLVWLEKDRETSALLTGLPESAQATGYVKDGFAQEGGRFTMNFYHEAGIIVTPDRAFTIAVFTQGNPEFPSKGVISELAEIIYERLTANAAD